MNKKGVILEIQENSWVVLTPTGEFLHVPRIDYAARVGEEVDLQVSKRTVPKRWHWKTFVSVTAAAMVGIFFVIPYLSRQTAYAATYVYVDDRLSLAVGLDEKERVIDIEPLNQPAMQVMQQMKWKDRPVDTLMVDLLLQAKHEGLVKPDDSVVLTGIQEEKGSATILHSLQQTIQTSQKLNESHLHLGVHTISISKTVQMRAKKKGLSPVKYAAWVLAKNSGKDLTPQQVDNTPMSELAQTVQPVANLLNQQISNTELNQIISMQDPSTGSTGTTDSTPTPATPDPTATQPTPADSTTPATPSDPTNSTDSTSSPNSTDSTTSTSSTSSDSTSGDPNSSTTPH